VARDSSKAQPEAWPPAAQAVLAGLDDEQRAAVTAPPGRVCILAGAGTGKTRAITHRIAYRVLTGQIDARHVLAVTFTARAAAQLRARLTELAVPGVQARTFHAAALRQLRFFAPRLLNGRELPEVVESKARLVGLAASRCGLRPDRTAARDLAGEIEWAKASLVEPGDYVTAAARAGRDSPEEPTKMAEVYAAYEEVKRGAGVIDFEDLLRAAVWAVEQHPDVADQVRGQYRHFVVDEYQDVNPAQERLLQAWLGERDDLTVVGDASQTIYSFTGASSTFLLAFARRCRPAGSSGGSAVAADRARGGTLVRLVRDYRSTPQVVALANQVIQQSQGAEARFRLELVGQRPDGPEPVLCTYPDESTEAAGVAARCAELVASGVPAGEIAVLFRTNAQSQAYEEALAEAGVPTVVRGAERFFDRAEIRRAVAALRAATRTDSSGDLRASVVTALEAVGWRPDAPPAGGAAREQWEAVAALVGIAEDFRWQPAPEQEAATPTPGPRLADFVAELARRAAHQHEPTVDGVTLASLHAAKGLEWDAVFLVGLVDGILPTTYARTPTAVEEERRLLYVGITRARQWLTLSYADARLAGGRARRPSRFLPVEQPGRGGAAGRREARGAKAVPDQGRGVDGTRRRLMATSCRVCGAVLTAAADRKLGRCATCPSTLDEDLFERLRRWRVMAASAQSVPAYVVFTDATLTALAERRPTSEAELVGIAGIGPHKLARYGEAVLKLVAGARPEDLPDVAPASGRSTAVAGDGGRDDAAGG
jgi:DNA helicase-2/ATP-dependent DNA helicase PcrA